MPARQADLSDGENPGAMAGENVTLVHQWW